MKLSDNCAQQIAAVVFGCAGLAIGGPAAAAITPAVGAVTLVAIAGNALTKAKPDDAKQIKKLIKQFADAADARSKTQPYERGKILRATQEKLLIYLPKIDISHARLGEDAFERGGFPEAATRRVLQTLAALEVEKGVEPEQCLFCGEHGKPDAIGLTEDIFNATFGVAFTERAYFEAMEPHLIVGIAEGIGDLKRGQGALADGQAEIMAKLAEMQAAQSVPPSLSDAQFISILSSFGHEEIPQTHWEDALRDSAAKLKELEAQLAQLSNDEPEIAALLDLAREAIDRADFAKAERHLADAEQRDIEAGEIRLRRAVSSREKRAELAAAQGRYVEAADHYAEAARRARVFDEMEWARLKFDEGGAAYERGQYDPEPDLLNRAITAYRAALEERTRDRVPLDWAMTQNNLGTALSTLGERGDEAALQEAITAYRSALEERTRDRVPLNWAATQNNLGNALLALGQRGDDAALQDAITAYRAALEEWTRDRVPLDWAMTQNNLGNAYQTMGDRDETREHWEQSVEYYRAALSVFEGAVPAYEKVVRRNLERVLGNLAA